MTAVGQDFDPKDQGFGEGVALGMRTPRRQPLAPGRDQIGTGAR